MVSDSTSSDVLAETTDRDLAGVDLQNYDRAERETICDREPIHIPNQIQPHGLLLVVSADEWNIVQVSLNTEEMLGIAPEELLNRPLSDLLGETQLTALKNCLSKSFDSVNPLQISIQNREKTYHFDGIVRGDDAIILVELEPSIPDEKEKIDFFDFYKLVKKPLDRLQNTTTLDRLCDRIAQEVKSITGFDRVMVYKFDREGAGKVVAEAVREELEPFLGLHYPATDIPKQAKHLYTLNYLRLIPDVAYRPVGLTPQLNPITNELLDMKMSVLRSVSPLHTEYLTNMGVAASMSISLLKNKQLWGLIACHHNSPQRISYKIRTVCEFIGQIVSFELAAKEDNQDLDYKMKLKLIQSQFVDTISQAEDLESGLTQNPSHLLDLVGAKGVVLSFAGNITSIGNTPNKETMVKMLPWLESQFKGDTIYETNCLSKVYPATNKDREVASGLLALLISRVQKTFIIWFRPEVVQTVNWGGNPHKSLEIDENGIARMSPRKSFAKWQETVRGKSLPWKTCEIEAALELRSSIVGIVLRKADQLSQVNKELARSNTELDAFAYIASHDLKEPLRGIYNYSSFLLEDYEEILDEAGVDKLNTLMRLTHRMEDLINSLLHYSRLGRAELQLRAVDLNDLVAGVLDVIRASARDTRVDFIIPRCLPTIPCDRTQINELFTNLISNGIKYNQKENKIIEIGYLDALDPIVLEKTPEYLDLTTSKTIFYVKDNGIGIREKHLETIFRIFKRLHGQKKYGGGTGAGLTIAKKIVERHGGEIWVKSIYGKDSTFYFTL